MKYAPQYYAQFLYTTKDPQLLLTLLEKHWITSWLSRIVPHYEALVRKHEKKAVVTITSARPLSSQAVEGIEQLLNKHQPNRELVLIFAIDESMLGGFNAQSQDIIIQGSLREQLNRLLM